MTTYTFGDVQEGDTIVLPDGRTALVTLAFVTDAHGGTLYGRAEAPVHHGHDPAAAVRGFYPQHLCEAIGTPVTILGPVAPRIPHATPTYYPALGERVTVGEGEYAGRTGTVQQLHAGGMPALLALDALPGGAPEPGEFAEPGKGALCVAWAVEPVA